MPERKFVVPSMDGYDMELRLISSDALSDHWADFDHYSSNLQWFDGDWSLFWEEKLLHANLFDSALFEGYSIVAEDGARAFFESFWLYLPNRFRVVLGPEELVFMAELTGAPFKARVAEEWEASWALEVPALRSLIYQRKRGKSLDEWQLNRVASVMGLTTDQTLLLVKMAASTVNTLRLDIPALKDLVDGVVAVTAS